MDRNFGLAVGALDAALIGCGFIAIGLVGGSIGFGIFYLLHLIGIFP